MIPPTFLLDCLGDLTESHQLSHLRLHLFSLYLPLILPSGKIVIGQADSGTRNNDTNSSPDFY